MVSGKDIFLRSQDVGRHGTLDAGTHSWGRNVLCFLSRVAETITYTFNVTVTTIPLLQVYS
jgi:hypothetical protein